MIVSTMNCQELVTELLLDFKSVINKSDQISRGLRRECIKTKNKKLIKFIPYISLRKNNWVITLKYSHPLTYATIFVHYLNKSGSFNAVLLSNNAISLNNVNAFHHISSHFLLRYNERFMKENNLCKIEILKKFITRNGFSIPKYYGCDQLYLKVSDGYVLGITEEIKEIRKIRFEIEVIHYNTFISDDMILDYQKEDCKELTDCFNRYFEEYPHEKKIHF